jgi:hypothetical protein
LTSFRAVVTTTKGDEDEADADADVKEEEEGTIERSGEREARRSV